METLETQKNAKKPLEYVCELCDFKCFKQSNYEKHLTTRKHQLSVNGNILDENGNKMETLETQKNAKPEFKCPCGKTYTTRGGLWKKPQSVKRWSQKRRKCLSQFPRIMLSLQILVMNI